MRASEGPGRPPSTRRVPSEEVHETTPAEVVPAATPARPRPAYGEIREEPSAELGQQSSRPLPLKKRFDARLVWALTAAGLVIALQAYQAGDLSGGWPAARRPEGQVLALPVGPAPTPEAPSATAPVSEAAVPTTTASAKPNSRYRTAPTPGRESQPTPLGTPAPVPTRSDSYAFLGIPELKQDIVTYDPCRPIHYVTRVANSPAGGQEMINQGFDDLSRITGLQFINDGETLEAPSEQRPIYQPDSYGDRWAPVLLAWSNSEESPRLSREQSGERFTEALGYAGSGAVLPSSRDRYVYVTGQVVLNTQALAEASAVEGPALTPSVIAHELAHLVGLDHVNDPTQLMYPESSYQRPTYADGDLTGLAALGRGTCSPGL